MRTGLTDVFAGTICSVLTITYSLSYAALIFSGPLAHFLSYGIAVTFMSRCLLREKVTRKRWIGVCLIFIGVSLVAART